MNKLIKKELNKLKIAKLGVYNSETNSFLIPKYTKIDVIENHFYILKLDDSLLEDSTLADNWNKGTKPPNNYIKAEISKIMANMVKVNAISYDYENNIDLNVFWNGWIIKDRFKIIDEI